MKLTCVTATFNCIKAGNRERLIRCIESVAKLKTEHEHLIYDGASKDGTVELLRELEVTIPSLKVVSEPDTGIYNALNKGVRDAKGEWFYVLGADDYVSHPDVMDALLNKHDCDQIVAPAETSTGLRSITTHSIFWGTPYCHQGVLQKTALIRQMGSFDEHFKIAADYDLFLKCHTTGVDIKYVKYPFAFFCRDGVSSTFINEMRDEFNKIGAFHFSTTPKSIARMRQQNYASIDVALSYWRDGDNALHDAARYALKEEIKHVLRIALWPIVVLRRKIRNRIAQTKAKCQYGGVVQPMK